VLRERFMPSSRSCPVVLIDTGAVDYVKPLAEIAPTLVHLVRERARETVLASSSGAPS